MEQLERDFVIRSYESGVNGEATLPNLCNLLQEMAGNHADKLGFGIRALQKGDGTSWVVSRLRVRAVKSVGWGETLRVRTWPSGIQRHFVATREFLGFNAAGEQVLEGTSDWLVVNLATMKIVRPSESFKALFGEAVPRTALAAEVGGGKFAALGKTDATARILVRRSDHDFNDHVNNVHYVEWILEALPELFRARRPCGVDIVFRQAAHAGDELEARAEVVDGRTLRHVIVRPSDGALLVTAQTEWAV